MRAIPVHVHADDALVRHGLTALLSGRDEVALLLDRDDEDDATPSVVVLDGSDVSSAASIQDWIERGTRVVTLVPDDATAAQLRRAGAVGVLHRDAPVDRLVAAIVAVANGLIVSDFDLTSERAERAPAATESWDESLTPRETEVLELLARGLANKQVAARLGVSEHTAKFHVNSILSKLGVQSRSEAIVRAARLGLITL